MAEATSIVLKRYKSDGEKTLYELKSVCTDAETVTIPTAETEITTSSIIQFVGINDVTNGTGGKGSTVTATYSKANRQFTVGNSGVTDADTRILFYVGD